jgi:hypothetical protein
MPFNFETDLDTLDAVPAEYQPAYAKAADGKFKIQDSFKPFVAAIVGTNASLGKTTNDLKKSNKEAADRRAMLKHFEDLATSMGIEYNDEKPLQDALKGYMDDLATKAKNGGEVKVDLEKIKKDYEKKHGELSAASQQTIVKMQKTLERYLVGQNITAALAKQKGSIELLEPVIAKNVKVLQEGDDYVVRVVDTEGNARSDGKGGWLSIEDFVGELKRQPVYARAFESDAAGGSGSRATGTARAAAAQNVAAQPREGMTANQKIAQGLKKGNAERGGRVA